MRCWQFDVKKEKELACGDNKFSVDYSDYKIVQIEYDRARKFILEYEWVGNMGTSKYCYGLMFKENLAAVVCYGPPVTPSKYSRLLGSEISKHLLQLCRGATTYWAPIWAPSKLISLSLRSISRNLGILAVIAYADPIAGEIGTVYQASNAIYIGTTSPGGSKRYVIHGHEYDPKKVQKKFGSRSHSHILQIDPNYHTIPVHKKHRYIYITCPKCMRDELVSKIRHIIEPYPKRDNSVLESN